MAILNVMEIIQLLCDPLTKEKLHQKDNLLQSRDKTYPIANNIPIMLIDEEEQIQELEKLNAGLTRTGFSWALKHWYDLKINTLLGEAEENKTLLLNFGSGSPREKENMEKQGYQVISMDINAKYKGVDVIADGHYLPFNDKVFDVVTAFEVLEHLRQPWVAIKEINRVISPGGRFVGSVAFLKEYHASYFHMSFLGVIHWTDSQKLSKQVSHLNERVDVSLCYHEWIKKDEESGQFLSNEIPAQSYPMPLTWMFRNHLKKIPLHFLNVLQEDDFLRSILKTKGRESYLFTISPSVYRVHSRNIWQSSDREFKYKSHINTTKQILKTYHGTVYETELKRRLKKQIIKKHKIIQSKNKNILYIFSLVKEMQNEQVLVLFVKDLVKRAVVKIFRITRISKLKNKGRYWNSLCKFKFKELNPMKTDKPIFLENAVANPYSGIVFINEKEILLNSIFSKRKWRSLFHFANSQASKDLPSATIIEHGPWNNYYHWHIDCVPRLWGLWSNPESAPDNLTLLISRNLGEEEEAIIKALLPSGIKINHVSKEDVFKVDHFLFLPFLSGNCSGKLPGEYLDFFISRMEGLFQLKKEKPKKIFISRKHSSKRRFTNQSEVEAFMEANGFHNLVLEDMKIAEQASWFYNAEVVVGLHGAGLTNLLYSRDTRVVEIFPFPNSHLNHYRDLCLAKGLSYRSIYLQGKSKNEDVHCPVSLLQEVISEFYAGTY